MVRRVKVQKLRGWVIVNNCGWMTYSVFRTRKEAIDDFLANWGWGAGATWRKAAYTMEVQAIQVLVTPVNDFIYCRNFPKRKPKETAGE